MKKKLIVAATVTALAAGGFYRLAQAQPWFEKSYRSLPPSSEAPVSMAPLPPPSPGGVRSFCHRFYRDYPDISTCWEKFDKETSLEKLKICIETFKVCCECEKPHEPPPTSQPAGDSRQREDSGASSGEGDRQRGDAK